MEAQVGNSYNDLELTPRNMAAFYGSSYFEGAQTDSSAMTRNDHLFGRGLDHVHTQTEASANADNAAFQVHPWLNHEDNTELAQASTASATDNISD